jgi:hypothetical protein
MLKKLLVVLLIACSFGCHKNQQQSACGTGQVCTALFASIGIRFTDKDGNPIAVKNYSAINQRTHLAMVNSNPPINPYGIGYYVVADDSARSQLSTEGDDVLVSATDPATNQTKTTTFKLSGGCNCHVDKLSGVEKVAFD